MLLIALGPDPSAGRDASALGLPLPSWSCAALSASSLLPPCWVAMSCTELLYRAR